MADQAEAGKGEGGQQAPTTSAAPPASQAPAAEAQKAAPAGIDPEAIKALEKKAARADKLEKELGALQERIKSPDFAKELIAGALGWNKEKDPQQELASIQQRASKAEQIAASAILRSAATHAALTAKVKPERVKHALNNLDLSGVKVNLETGAVENPDAFADIFTGLRSEIPEFFVQDAPPADKGAPLPGPKPPVVTQPQGTPVPPPLDAVSAIKGPIAAIQAHQNFKH